MITVYGEGRGFRVVWLLEGCLAVALAIAVGLAFLQPLPGNQPAGAQRTGS